MSSQNTIFLSHENRAIVTAIITSVAVVVYATAGSQIVISAALAFDAILKCVGGVA